MGWMFTQKMRYVWLICMYIPYSQFFEEENFHEFHKLIAICENCILEIMFTKNILSLAVYEIFPVEKLE